MWVWTVFAISAASALLLDGSSFTSPLFPDHSRKFYMLGSAIPLRTSVRVVPGSQRKTGSIVGMNPISETEFSLEVSGTTTGKQQIDDEGGLTIWFTPTYARHIAVGSMHGVNPRIQGVLVVYDFRRGLVGYEKLTEDGLPPEGLPMNYQCAPPAASLFNFTLTFTEATLQVEYETAGKKVFCFRLPVAKAPERFLGLSAICGYPCQRGVDVFSVQTHIVVNDQRFVAKMQSDNAKLESILGTIVGDFEEAAKAIRPKFDAAELEKVAAVIADTKVRLAALSTRVASLHSHSTDVLEQEKSDEKSQSYYQSLSTALTSLELSFENLAREASTLNIPKVVENYVKANGELVGNERQINSMVRTMQKHVGSYQAVAMSEDKFYAVYGVFGVVGLVGGYLYWRLRRAGKHHEI